MFLEAVKVRERGRCTIPGAVRHGLAWVSPGSEVLAVIRPGGRVCLHPWEHAQTIRTHLETLKTGLTGPEAEDAAEQFLLLQDRYQRLRTERITCRLEFPAHIASHLGVIDGGTIFTVRFPKHVELWSETYRERRLAEAEAEAEAAGLDP